MSNLGVRIFTFEDCLHYCVLFVSGSYLNKIRREIENKFALLPAKTNVAPSGRQSYACTGVMSHTSSRLYQLIKTGFNF